jgi:dihydrofolate reductase
MPSPEATPKTMKTILYMSMTANGYIARENGDTPWSREVWDGYYEFVKKRGNIILGRKTYDELAKEANGFEKIGYPFTVVVSNSTQHADDPNAVFVSSPKDALAAVRQKGFDEVVIGGGGTVNAGFLKDGLIDEISLDIDPLLFGKGIKLFADTDAEAKLELLQVDHLSKNTIQLRYKVISYSS